MSRISFTKAVEKLVDDDINTIIQSNQEGDDTIIADVLERGFIGYAHYSIKELQKEMLERFNKKYKVLEDKIKKI